MKTNKLLLSAVLIVATSLNLSAGTVYWDGNGNGIGGAGITPTGTWGTSTFWNSNSAGLGASATAAWVSGDTAVFSAGTDATGAFSVTLSGTQTAAGLFVEEGIVSFTGTGAVSLGTGSVTISPGATLSIDNSARISTTAGGSKLFLDASTIQNTVGTTAGTFFDTDTEIVLGAGGGTLSYTGVNLLNIVQTASKITGTGSLTKTGAGVLAIASTAGNNTYSGGTIVNDGELRIRTVVNTLPITTALTVNSPGIFNLNNVSQQVGSLTGAGLVGLGNGTLTVGDATSTIYSGSIRDTANAGAAGSTSVGGKVTKVGAGTLTLSGLNIQTGVTTLSAGTITVDSTGSLSGPTAPLTVNAGALNMNNAAQTVSTLSGTGGTINLATGHVLTTDPAASSTYSGTIAGAGGLTKLNVLSGATNRTLTLSGSNTYDGNTLVSGGNIAVGSATALGSTVGYTDVASGAEVVFTGAGVNFTVSEPFQIAGAGNSDAGVIAVIASASPTFNGTITLTGDATVTVSSSASATFAASFTSPTNKNLTLAGGANAAGTKLISGAIALGTGGLTKTQGGTWILAGTNTYSGTTTINSGGTLQLGTGLAGGDGTISNSPSVANSGTLTFNRFGSDNYVGVISGAGALTKTGAGTQTLSGANTYTGVTTINAGVLSVATIGNGGVASGNLGSATNAAANLVFDGGTLQYTGATASTDRNFTINAGKTAFIDVIANNLTISGGSTATTGALTKIGAGILTLAGANTFTGATTVNAGTLAVSATGTLGSTVSVAVNAGGTLLLGGSDRINDAATVTLAGGTFNTGGFSETVGMLTLSADSIIDMGAGSSLLRFADSQAATWTGTLSIWNWSGTPINGGGIDQLYFGNGPGVGLTPGQLSQINFFSDNGLTKLSITAAFPENVFVGAIGEVVPVPEPSGVAVTMGLLGLVGWRECRKAGQSRASERRAADGSV